MALKENKVCCFEIRTNFPNNGNRNFPNILQEGGFDAMRLYIPNNQNVLVKNIRASMNMPNTATAVLNTNTGNHVYPTWQAKFLLLNNKEFYYQQRGIVERVDPLFQRVTFAGGTDTIDYQVTDQHPDLLNLNLVSSGLYLFSLGWQVGDYVGLQDITFNVTIEYLDLEC